MNNKDIANQKFGNLTALYPAFSVKKYGVLWACSCSCGSPMTVLASTNQLIFGSKKHCPDCGNESHGLTKSRLYHVYIAMKRRCSELKDPAYNNYGGRGISVCDEWKNSFIAFKDWAIQNGYKDKSGLSIDRINNDGNYEPSNCQWVSKRIQDNNKRTNNYHTINGQTKTLTQWADEYQISVSTLRFRLRRGIPFETALTTPINAAFSRKAVNP